MPTTQTIAIHDDGKTPTSELLARCKEKFNVYSYWDDKELDSNFPSPKEPTTRHFRDNQEADAEFANMSADDLEKIGHQGITLRERVIMELQYFEKTGNHLDIENWTLCSGSRLAGGYVPYAYWYGSEFKVRWYYRDYRHQSLRSRAVSLPTFLPSYPSDLEKRVAELENQMSALRKFLVF